MQIYRILRTRCSTGHSRECSRRGQPACDPSNRL